MATEQLRLINSGTTRRIDEHTREVGRRGLAEARAALAAAIERRAERDERLKSRHRSSAA